MTDQKTTAPTMNALNRALLRTLTASAEAADIIADRLEELERERDSAQLREAEQAKALKATQEGLSFVLKHLSEDKPATFPNKWWNDLSMIEADARAALQSREANHASQNNPKETKA